MKITLNDLNEIGAYTEFKVDSNFNNEGITFITITCYTANHKFINYQTYDFNKLINLLKFLEENGNN